MIEQPALDSSRKRPTGIGRANDGAQLAVVSQRLSILPA